jgi:adenine-specific DNA methylase
MILTNEGKKEYSSIDQYDLELYEKASRDFQNDALKIPNVEIHPGHNTDQILNYNYRHWSQLFNERQLLCLGILAQRIKKIEKEQLKELFVTLFSGCLEFNNMFCSFKGEGTGAVRHMFSHHILKPEKMPLEANVWGTPKSSGSFSTLFRQRVIRSLEYKNDPFELYIEPETGSTKKVRKINDVLTGTIASNYAQFKEGMGYDTYLSCGSSDQTDIQDHEVDFVITDPPFFANVQYSELADFFYVWQREIFEKKGIFESETTRSEKEIQQVDAKEFGRKLASVFSDCNRVLKDDGLMIFTFHQSHVEGWTALLDSLRKSGFYIERVYFVKSEMSVAVPKSQAKSPIDLDAVIACRKLIDIPFTGKVPENLVGASVVETKQSIRRFAKVHFERLSINDLKNMLISNMMTSLSLLENDEIAAEFIMSQATRLENLAAELRKEQDQPK